MNILFFVRVIIGIALSVAIWIRVDWTVGLLALILLADSEVKAYYFYKLTKHKK